MLRRLSGWLGCAALLFVVGCGSGDPSVSYVEGVVTFDGSPLEGATVIFSPVEESGGRAAAGITDASGTYTLTDMQATSTGKGAAPGQYRVAISKVNTGASGQITGGESEPTDEMEDAGNASPTATIAAPSAIPESYNRPDSSGLTATIESGSNTGVNFELTSTP